LWIAYALLSGVRDVLALAALAGLGALVYAAAILALFGPRWLADLWHGSRTVTPSSVPPAEA